MPPVLEIFGVIGWEVTLDSFNQDLKELREKFPNDTLLVKINSPGGKSDIGYAIAHLIQDDGNIDCMNIGLAASSAGFILQAGRRRLSANQSMTMMHRTWIWGDGNATEFQKLADMLKEWDSEIIKVIQTRTKIKDAAEIETLLEEPGWWRNSENALADGLIDEIIKTEQKQPLPSNSVQYITKNYGSLPFNILNQIIEHPKKGDDMALTKEDLEQITKATQEGNKPLVDAISNLATKLDANKAEPVDIEKLTTEVANKVVTPLAEKHDTAMNAMNEATGLLKASNDSIVGVVAALEKIPLPNNKGGNVWGVGGDNIKTEDETFAI